MAPRAGLPRATNIKALDCQTGPNAAFDRKGFSGALANPLIVQRDDGLFEIGLDGAGPFETRAFAEAVADTGDPPDKTRSAARQGSPSRKQVGLVRTLQINTDLLTQLQVARIARICRLTPYFAAALAPLVFGGAP